MKKPKKSRLDWSKFWWKDWQNDLALKSCSYAARGLWMEMLAIMSTCEKRGFFMIAGRAVTPKKLAGLTNGSEREVVKLIDELRENGVFSEDETGLIYSRRMKRDQEVMLAAIENGSKGGNPTLIQNTAENSDDRIRWGLTPSDNHTHKLQEARSKNTPIVPTGDADTQDDNGNSGSETEGPARDFEAFWAAYPRKDGKASARKAYDKARRKIGHEAIMRAVSAWPFGDNLRNGQDYRPHPASWLNGERWNDESVTAVVAAKPTASQYPPEVEAAFVAARREWARTGCEGKPPMRDDFLGVSKP
ncbi:hypothetical protein [Asaia spathodeae]|uniref:Phage replisome organiser N-terminal domain-containing protein n=1 Tax=Asaia spathodeae TaxID=657016 RepID=A0ABX2P6D6_9PROT|nr:hypothetical protein [Asaia spathodeae]GBR19792.1 hypothetical protein AA105894_2399 [Asaia spathodeae NBRC 105894]